MFGIKAQVRFFIAFDKADSVSRIYKYLGDKNLEDFGSIEY